jgi:hypothetical protein
MNPLFHMISGAPDPVAPFSHAVESDGWVFVTGQMPFVGTSLDSPYPEGIEAQTRHEDYDKMNAVPHPSGAVSYTGRMAPVSDWRSISRRTSWNR